MTLLTFLLMAEEMAEGSFSQAVVLPLHSCDGMLQLDIRFNEIPNTWVALLHSNKLLQAKNMQALLQDQRI